MMEVKAYKRLKYVLELRVFVVDKLPDDDNLVPKHVGVGAWYEVYSVIYFIVF